MDGNTIIINEYLRIIVLKDGIYIETFKKNFPLSQLNSALASLPQINITDFNAIRTAINTAPHSLQKIGELKERIILDTVDNSLKTIVVFNMSIDELDLRMRESLIKELSIKLKEKNIVFGIKTDILIGEIISGRPYIIAVGTCPINGEDSTIKMYKLEDINPIVTEDGNVNYYELKLINRVKAGDWLGERIEATEGIAGKSVFGNTLRPIKGKNFPLLFDKNSVSEIFDNPKTTLYARIDGAASYDANGKIMISNHLEIDGDIDFRIGNITFDGYITINGTVSDGFSVQATKDIEIKHPLGLGNVKNIISTTGSVYIRGGISAKGGANITACKNIFTKFVDSSTLRCGGLLNIGFYCINSTVNAGEVILDSSNGQIIGGNVTAEIRVVSPIIGSEIEKRTTIIINGFNKEELLIKLDVMSKKIVELKADQQKLKQSMAYLDSQQEINPYQRREYTLNFEKILLIRDEIIELEEKRKSFVSYLKVHGEGEIAVSKKIYPNCSFKLKGVSEDIYDLTFATTYFVVDKEIKKI